jgi:hypothetical protein
LRGVCRHTPSVQYLLPGKPTAVLYSLRACTRHTRTPAQIARRGRVEIAHSSTFHTFDALPR